MGCAEVGFHEAHYGDKGITCISIMPPLGGSATIALSGIVRRARRELRKET